MNIEGVIERRLLVNYRADPAAIEPLLPAGLRPQLVGGHAVVGICLIRLGAMRPQGWPGAIGLRSENAAHRIAVEWGGGSGVFIHRRDTDARINVLVGGRLFPGVHHRAEFRVAESTEKVEVGFDACDGSASVHVVAAPGATMRGELFRSVHEASEFFRLGAVGLSPGRADCALEGVVLETDQWRVEPADILAAASSYFDALPAGSVELDHALIMRDVPVVWRPSASSARRHAAATAAPPARLEPR